MNRTSLEAPPAEPNTIIDLRDGDLRDVGIDPMVEPQKRVNPLVALAAVGSGIALVPALVLDASPQRNHLTVLRPPRPLPSLDIGLCALRRATDRQPLSLLWSMNA